MSYHTNDKQTSGFTLIELLVVIAVIGLLSTLAVIALGSAREKARDSERVSNLKQIQTMLERHYADNNRYPVQVDPAALGVGDHACLNMEGFGPTGCANAYMAVVPTDPSDMQYQYQSEDGTTYSIRATLEGDLAGLSAGSIVASPSGIVNQ